MLSENTAAQLDDTMSDRWANIGNDRGVGPQGAALIMELQRLRQALEHDQAEAPSEPRRGASSTVHRKSARPKGRQKGKMGRVIDACLEQFGLASLARSTHAKDPKPDAASAPQSRRDGPEIASDAPSMIDLEPDRLQLKNTFQSMQIDSPPMQLPPASGGERSLMANRLVAVCQDGLSASISFLLNSEGAAESAVSKDANLAFRTDRSLERELRTGLRVLLIVGLLAGGWAALVPLAGAVVVPGNLVVQSNVKTVQHPTGGVVAEIAVQNGQRVSRGDLLVRLDATQAQASLQVISKQLDETRARIARLVAERDGLRQIAVPGELADRAGEDVIKALLTSEQSLFTARSNARRSQIDVFQSRISQLGEQIAGLDAQVEAKTKQLDLIAGELTGVQDLYDKHLVPLARLTALQRESARIEGERGQLTSSIAETRSKTGEAQLQILKLEHDFRSDVVKELGESQAKEAEFVERSTAARDVLDRIEIRAPASGVIQQLSVHSIGGVIRAGDTIMEIVPDLDDLQIEARLPPNDIDQVRMGQSAFVRFSAFNQRVTPQVGGTVSYVSPDTSRDQQTNTPYFTVRVSLPEDERRRLAGLQLVPGMPAEVFMQTGSRTMMSYLLKPIADQMRRAFVER
ncbi:HlyD family type I secretion periplasmic adaptor subunit [Bradyrhizobium sp.]|jgi:membrane fusion protein, type I secretion system|uniref:HlyD family type I secretion periplasmic adaptor subunit n=1 Tax=Bradyrhizobium sp. TaxID=376 RepID=UPI002D689853|nr:HlyD family type I secretion periplasmic adaptor subunit [Bradyrhizobium sp.]HZR77441.1 HlyD family type I secretion periplasmic adaptor subunit [Bradyrhizobium sp.]